MKQPVCRRCNGKVLHGNLYCSERCEQNAADAVKVFASELKKAGFVADPEIPNVYLKDGVATTLEHVAHVGLPKALAQHGHAVEARRV